MKGENYHVEKMKEMIADQLGIGRRRSLRWEASFKDDLDADSLDLFELVMALEDEYDIEIPSEQLEAMSTVGDIYNFT